MFGHSRNSTFGCRSWPRSSGWLSGQGTAWNQESRPWFRNLGSRSGRPSSSRVSSSTVSASITSFAEAGQSVTTAKLAEIEDNQNLDPIQRRRRTEAVLLFHRGPVPLRKLAQLAGLADATEARTLLRQLNEIYDRSGSALRVEEIAGGYQLLTRAGLAPWLRRFASAPPSIRLSTPAMETLAVVAYRQPVLRANIEAIRGVACGEILRQLMQRDLVRICGRSEELGRPYLYGTTKHFLQTFGLKDVQTLPKMSGAGVEDDSEDTCAILADQDQAMQSVPPIETT